MSVNDDHVLLKVLEREIQHINSKLDELKDQIAGLSEVMDKQVLCPAPGTCVTLLHRIQTVESKIEHHEKNLEHLTAAGLVDQAAIAAINELSWAPATIDPRDVSRVMMPRRPGGHL